MGGGVQASCPALSGTQSSLTSSLPAPRTAPQAHLILTIYLVSIPGIWVLGDAALQTS